MTVTTAQIDKAIGAQLDAFLAYQQARVGYERVLVEMRAVLAADWPGGTDELTLVMLDATLARQPESRTAHEALMAAHAQYERARAEVERLTLHLALEVRGAAGEQRVAGR